MYLSPTWQSLAVLDDHCGPSRCSGPSWTFKNSSVPILSVTWWILWRCQVGSAQWGLLRRASKLSPSTSIVRMPFTPAEPKVDCTQARTRADITWAFHPPRPCSRLPATCAEDVSCIVHSHSEKLRRSALRLLSTTFFDSQNILNCWSNDYC